MLKKDLLYTAVTRASKSLSLIGEPQAFVHSVESQQNLRNTALKERLQFEQHQFTSFEDKGSDVEDKDQVKNIENDKSEEKKQNKRYILTSDLVNNYATDPMIGMDKVKP